MHPEGYKSEIPKLNSKGQSTNKVFRCNAPRFRGAIAGGWGGKHGVDSRLERTLLQLCRANLKFFPELVGKV